MSADEDRKAFEQWCPIKITDAEKAPKADALVKAYWTAWQAALAWRCRQRSKPTLPVGVSVLLTNKHGQFLMAKRRNVSAQGLISTPGGRVEELETIPDCARREFVEETGAVLGPLAVIGWREHFRFEQHYIMFYIHASSFEGVITNCIPDKSENWEWMDRRSLTVENCTEPQEILDLVVPAPPAPEEP